MVSGKSCRYNFSSCVYFLYVNFCFAKIVLSVVYLLLFSCCFEGVFVKKATKNNSFLLAIGKSRDLDLYVDARCRKRIKNGMPPLKNSKYPFA